MLEQLRIRGLAIIDEINVEFERGLTTITGETGAGKSLLLGALRLLAGERSSAEVVGGNHRRARLEAEFRVNDEWLQSVLVDHAWLDEHEPSRVLVRREIFAAGGSRHYINDVAVPLGRLVELGASLLAIHGQNDQASLLSPATQLQLLDAFGHCEEELARYKRSYVEARQAALHLEKLLSEARDLERRRSYLRFQLDEIDRANLVAGEEEELEVELQRLRHAERLMQAVRQSLEELYEGERAGVTVATMLASIENILRQAASYDPSLGPYVRLLEEMRVGVEGLAQDLRAYLRGLDADPQRLATVEDRLALIRGLTRKYAPTVAEVLAQRDRLANELELLENYETNLAQAQERLSAALEELKAAAEVLTLKRAAAARTFQELVEREMQQLSLPGARFQVVLQPHASSSSEPLSSAGGPSGEDGANLIPDMFGPDGADRVEFLALLNVGDEPRPLRKIASGGELSRIMLAVECVLAEKDRIPVLVFDEIDAGISGEAAERVGEKLCQLARAHQVLCITHLPQIAACGHQQLVVEKHVRQGRTMVEVHAVTGEGREKALARMLAGASADAESRRYARRLLQRLAPRE